MNTQKTDWKIRCVIYDCDGVLFDSLEANTKLYNDLCAIVGRSLLREEELNYVHTHTVFEALHFIFGKENDLEKKERLKERGILRAINTNRTTSMKYIMERFDLWPCFEMVVTALDVKNPKPHPESIEKIVKELNLNKEEAVFVGDSDVDQQTAKSSAIKFIAYKNKEIASDAYLEDHLDILKLLP